MILYFLTHLQVNISFTPFSRDILIYFLLCTRQRYLALSEKYLFSSYLSRCIDLVELATVNDVNRSSEWPAATCIQPFLHWSLRKDEKRAFSDGDTAAKVPLAAGGVIETNANSIGAR